MRAVFLLHGFVTDKRDFAPLIPLLEAKYDCVYPITFPGHGEEPNFKEFTVEATFSHLLNEFDKLQAHYDHIDVIGFSMGGALASYLSTVRQFDKLVLLAPANKYLNPASIYKTFSFYFNSTTEMRKSKNIDEEKYQEAKKRIEYVNENTKISLLMGIKTLIPRYTLHNLKTFIRVIAKCNENLVEIKNPVLIIWGKLDQLVPIKSIEYDYSLCSNENKKLVILEDLTHLMLQSCKTNDIENEVMTFLQ